MEALSVPLYIIISLFLLAFFSISFLKRNEQPKAQEALKLPPGSMGLPWFGETLQLYSQDPNIFFSEKQRRFLKKRTKLSNLSKKNTNKPEILTGFLFLVADLERFLRPTFWDVLV